MRPNLRWLAIALLLPFSVVGCTSPPASNPSATGTQTSALVSPAAGGTLEIVTMILPMYLFTKAVAGDAAKVDILIQPGTEVHEYQSTPADVQAIARADVVVENGLGLEEFLDSTIESAQNPDLKVIDASETIEPVSKPSSVVHPGAGAAESDHDEGRIHAANPHVWLDPVLAAQQVKTIRDGLMAADPSNKATYAANAAAYVQQLQALDRQFRERLQPFGDRSFITFHDAFPYLAQRYALQQVAIVAIPEDNLSPDDVRKTINAVREFKAKALLGEPGIDNKLLQSLSQDLNLQIKVLDSMESGELDPQYYFTAMEQNLKTLEDAFK